MLEGKKITLEFDMGLTGIELAQLITKPKIDLPFGACPPAIRLDEWPQRMRYDVFKIQGVKDLFTERGNPSLYVSYDNLIPHPELHNLESGLVNLYKRDRCTYSASCHTHLSAGEETGYIVISYIPDSPTINAASVSSGAGEWFSPDYVSEAPVKYYASVGFTETRAGFLEEWAESCEQSHGVDVTIGDNGLGQSVVVWEEREVNWAQLYSSVV